MKKIYGINRHENRKMFKIPERVGFGKAFVGIFSLATIACLAGALGLIVAMNILVALPLLIMLVNGNQDVEFTDSNGRRTRNGQGQGVAGESIENAKQYWDESSNTKKVAIVGGMGLLLPLILMVGMFAIVIAIAFAVDLLIVVPIALLVGYLFFKNPVRQTNSVTKALGNPITGFIGVVGVVVIMVFAISSWADLTMHHNGADNVVDYMEPVHTMDGDTYENSTYDPATGTWHNVTMSYTLDRVLFHVQDDFFYGAGFVSYINQTFDNNTNELSVTDTDGAIPVDKAKISINGVSKKNGEYIHLGGLTDGSGDFLFQNVPYGLYEITVDATGYGKFTKTDVHIAEPFGNGTVTIHMMPIYYKLGIEYIWINETIENSYDFRLLAGFGARTYESDMGEVMITPYWAGALEKDDYQRLNRQQSMWGWTGIPRASSLNNQLLKLNNQMGVMQQSMYDTMGQFVFKLFMPRLVEKASYSYNGHSIIPTQATVTDANGYPYDTYYAQLPTPNDERIGYNLLIDDWNVTRETAGITNDTSSTSGLTQRLYEWIVWSEIPESNSIYMQFDVKTFITNTTEKGVDSYVVTYYSESTENAEILQEYVDITYTLKLPTVETLIDG